MQSLDEANIAFWNELCGSQLAKVLGISDASPDSLRKFDDWYFDFYPYLLDHVALRDLKHSDVLEVGLGYGSLSQKLAECGARYTGLDIAVGPVEMVNHRLRQCSLPGSARQGSLLEAPFPDNSFDYIAAIGCLHHTGNMERGIAECRRLLRPGGALTMMVYNAYSYRRLVQDKLSTLRYLRSELFGYRGVARSEHEQNTWSYDHNEAGELAPHTDFISVKSLRHLCRQFTQFKWQKRNIDQEKPFENRSRKELLKTAWPSICGLDIYATVVK